MWFSNIFPWIKVQSRVNVPPVPFWFSAHPSWSKRGIFRYCMTKSRTELSPLPTQRLWTIWSSSGYHTQRPPWLENQVGPSIGDLCVTANHLRDFSSFLSAHMLCWLVVRVSHNRCEMSQKALHGKGQITHGSCSLKDTKPCCKCSLKSLLNVWEIQWHSVNSIAG